MEEVRVNLAERSYSILIGQGLIQKTGSIFKERALSGRILVVTNPTVAEWYLEPLLQSLNDAGYTAEVAEIPDGEEYKSLEQANHLYNTLIESKYDRSSVLIALGGGVIGDLTGFVASTYMRGVGFVQIPTSLLAQVDSSIGGKVGINHPLGKNMIGAFYQPKLVISDVETLETLPERELNSGLGEVIKHGVILDENYFRFILGELTAVKNADPGIMTWVVTGSCKIKAKVVEEDEQESGLRAVLNFGHTVGHALETITNYGRFKHGEAITIGMLAAGRIASQMGILAQPDLCEVLEETFDGLGLPISLEGLPVKEIYRAICHDKKAVAGSIRWILPQRMGQVMIASDVTQQLVETVLRDMGGSE